MKAKLLEKARLKFPLQRRWQKGVGNQYRVIEETESGNDLISLWDSSIQLVTKIRRRVILNYCHVEFEKNPPTTIKERILKLFKHDNRKESKRTS